MYFVPIASIFPFVFWFDINLELATLGPFAYKKNYVCASLRRVWSEIHPGNLVGYITRKWAGRYLGESISLEVVCAVTKRPCRSWEWRQNQRICSKGYPASFKNPPINCSFRHICHSSTPQTPQLSPECQPFHQVGSDKYLQESRRAAKTYFHLLRAALAQDVNLQGNRCCGEWCDRTFSSQRPTQDLRTNQGSMVHLLDMCSCINRKYVSQTTSWISKIRG
jgi:hypothetical protein